jgi:pyruvate,water dikinase
LRLSDVTLRDRPRVGGKVMPLARLAADGLPVPPAFIVPTDVFRRVLEEAGLLPDAEAVAAGTDGTAAARLRAALADLVLPGWLVGALDRSSQDLGGLLAVRSSAIDEDGRRRSFAGQHHTSLGVRPGDVAAAVVRCWASLYAEGALAYRGASGPPVGSMAVLVQRMVRPRVAGVLFTINPMTGSWHEMTVEATWGLAEGLVSGQVAPHWFLVRRPRRTPRPVQRVLARVRLQSIQADVHPIDRRWVVGEDGAVVVEPVPEDLRRRTTLPPHDLRRLCRLGLRVEAHLGAPQDVEWAIDASGRPWLLQARPVTTGQVPRARRDVLWTRRFVGERFPQPLPPLTWSLVQPLLEHFVAYPDVQRRFLGGGSALRLVEGRVYLNATVFGHLAFKLPGLPPPRFMLELLPPDEADAFRRRFAVMPDLSVYAAIFRTTFDEERWRRFAWNPLTNPEAWEHFEADLLAALPGVSRSPGSPTDALRLVEDQRELQRDYIGVHICSLLFANLFDQLLEALLNAWLPDHAVEAHRALATTPPGNWTLVVNRALVELGAEASADDLARLEAGWPAEGAFAAALERFLADYGHRSEASWDVFAPRWRQDPSRLAPLLRSYREGEDPDEHAARQQAAFEGALRGVEQALAGSWRGAVLERVIALLRTYLLLRENQRFRFEQLQWAQQQTLMWIGEHLVDSGVLVEAADIRFLAWDEVRGLVEGSLAKDDPAAWVARRKQAHVAHQRASPPAFIRGEGAVPELVEALRLQGSGISPGRITGRVRVVRDLSEGDALLPGEILVAPAVDPAWTPLFLSAGGVVLELGSRLSHGAVIAREYRVPGVVNVDRATTRLRDGQEVTVDGTRGIVFVHP